MKNLCGLLRNQVICDDCVGDGVDGLLNDAADEIERLSLTAEEFDALSVACGDSHNWDKPHVRILLGLVARHRTPGKRWRLPTE